MKNYLIVILIGFIATSATNEQANSIFAKEKNKKNQTSNKIAYPRNFTFEDAMKFEILRNPRVPTKISNNGNWLGYEIQKDRGDVAACINSTKDTTKFRFENGRGIAFSNNANWAAMTIQANQMETENAKTPRERPNNSLKLINLQTKEEFNAENLQSFKFSEDSRWLAYQMRLDDANKPKMEKFKDKSLGSPLKLKHLNSGSEITIDWVSNYLFDTNSKFIFYTLSTPNGKNDGVYCRELMKEFAPEKKILVIENSNFSNLAWNEKNNLLAFLATSLTDKGKPKDCNLLLWNELDNKIDTAISEKTQPKDWYIPSTNKLAWNESKTLLYFGFKPVSEKVEEQEPIKFKDSTLYNFDTLLAKAEVHIWHWDDPLIMTQQQVRWRTEKDRTYYAVYDFAAKKYVQISDTLVIDVLVSKNDNFALATTDKPHRKEQTWYGTYVDAYAVNLKNGNKQKIIDRIEEMPSMSTSGNYVVFYQQKHWYLYDTRNNTTVNLTLNVNTNFNDVFQDIPSNPYSNRFGGWVDDDKGFFLYDNWDIWYFETENLGNYRCFTQGKGKETNTKYTLRRLNLELNYFDSKDTLIVQAFNKSTKDAGVFNGFLNPDRLENRIAMSNHSFREISKAKDTNVIIFAKEKYDEFPNYYVTDLALNSPKRVTSMNLAIKDTFNWGHTELVEWKYNDTILQGYLVKPDNYNPSKKYPVMVYFYDQMSDRMNRFYMPELTHRPVNQIYMDNYIMFFCDVKYGVGSPGNDALESLLSGCRHLARKGIIDTNKACLQGHSWAGYQAAYIVTQTDFFKAACAGAPVGNMISAYSGIRTGSGMARQFQYEAQQSRIGGNLWDSLDAYIRNSPIFFAEKMNTPFLIGFGDVDEAVPYQQGVELYLALRRAGKPAIMLQYVNEPHWQSRYWNKLDYSVKMKEFFDHYVLGAPAPAWITIGRPYKGETFGK